MSGQNIAALRNAVTHKASPGEFIHSINNCAASCPHLLTESTTHKGSFSFKTLDSSDYFDLQ